MCGHKKLTNTRDPNRDPNRSSACDFLETARLFAARCVCGRCRKEKIEKLQPTIQCAQINIRPPHGQLFILPVALQERSVCEIPAALAFERRIEGEKHFYWQFLSAYKKKCASLRNLYFLRIMWVTLRCG